MSQVVQLAFYCNTLPTSVLPVRPKYCHLVALKGTSVFETAHCSNLSQFYPFLIKYPNCFFIHLKNISRGRYPPINKTPFQLRKWPTNATSDKGTMGTTGCAAGAKLLPLAGGEGNCPPSIHKTCVQTAGMILVQYAKTGNRCLQGFFGGL